MHLWVSKNSTTNFDICGHVNLHYIYFISLFINLTFYFLLKTNVQWKDWDVNSVTDSVVTIAKIIS